MEQLKNEFIAILNKISATEQTNPDSKFHNMNKDYIRALITRIQISQNYTIKQIAKQVGISTPTLNRYISHSKDSRDCPYSIQYLFERLSGMTKNGSLYKFELEHDINKNKEFSFLTNFDEYHSPYNDSPLTKKIDFKIALDEDELSKMECFLIESTNNIKVNEA